MKTKLIIPIILLILMINVVSAISVTAKIEPTTAYTNDTLKMYCNGSGGVYSDVKYEWEVYQDGVKVSAWNDWVSDSSLVSGLVDVGTYGFVSIFQDGSTWKLITGDYNGKFSGFYWNDTSWVSNSSIVNGLGDVGWHSTPFVFNDSGTLKLISGEENGNFNGFYWNDTSWVSNSSIITGLGDVGLNSAPNIYKDGSTWKLISGEKYSRFGFQWNGTSWVSNSSIVSGLSNSEYKAKYSIFNDSGTWRLVSGAGADNSIKSYYWSGSTWVSDSSFISALSVFEGYSSPYIYKDNSIWKLIFAMRDGTFTGYKKEPQINYSQEVFSNIINISFSDTLKGENWSINCKATETGNESGLVSTDIIISNSIPSNGISTISNISLLLTGNGKFIDINEDLLNYEYKWLKNNITYEQSNSSEGDIWGEYNSYVSGLVDVGGYSRPSVFLDGSTWKLIKGVIGGTFTGYQWNTNSWVENTSIVNGLVNTGGDSAPEVFKDGSTWKLITGRYDGTFDGYYWSGSTWVSDSSMITGLFDVDTRSSPAVFQDGIWKLITGRYDGTFDGYRKLFTQNQNYDIATLDVSTSDFNKGDEIIFSLKADDFTEYSSWVNSSIFTIPNRVPLVTTSILPSFTTTTMDLLGYANGTDVDDSDSLIFDWEWYKDGVLNSSGSTTNLTQGNHLINTLSSSLTSYGETWTFRCKVNDGTANSSWVNSTTLIDVYPPLLLYVNPQNNSNNSSKNVLLKSKIDTKGLSINMTFLDESYNIIEKFNSILNDTIYSKNWLRNWSTNYQWYINLTYMGTNKLYNFNFTTKSQPLPTNYRIEEITSSSANIFWDNNTDIEWTSYTLYRNGEVDATGVTINNDKLVSFLTENTLYTLQWQVGDSAPSESDYYNFTFRTSGWMPELQNWSYKRLITINSSNIASDIENGAINISLNNDNFKVCLMYCEYPGWEVWGSGFSHLNWTNGTDIRFVDYYETKLLDFNITSINIGGDGGMKTQTIPDETTYTGTWDNYSLCHDNDWNSRCIPNTYAEDYFNYTIPEGALTSSTFRSYIGEYYWDGSIPLDCFGGDKLRFKIVSNYTKPSAYIYCQNNSDDSWIYIYDNGNVSSYNYESMVTWYYDGQIDLIVKPTHFNDANQNNTEGIDGDYDTKFWMYYGNSESSSGENEIINYSSLSNADYSVDTESTYTESAPTISNVIDDINKNDSFTTINWTLDKKGNNRIIYATNEWFLDSSYTEWKNDTFYPSINLTSMENNTEYYYRLYSESISSGLSSTYEDSLIFGILLPTPSGRFYNYTENRIDAEVSICFEVTDMNGNSNLDTSIQYWNEDSTTFNETASNNINSIGLVCRNIPVNYGKTYNYRLKMVGETTGYSSEYTNEFMPIQEFFAGSYIEDDMDYRHRQYCPNGIGTTPCYEQKGYREGSAQEEDWIWIETNITNQGSLSVEWYDGSTWSSYPMTLDDSDFYYKKLENLNQSYQTFYIKNDTSVILNWTKPDLEHNNTGLRTETTKYVSFDNTQGSLDYQIVYLDYELFKGTAFDHCIESGGNLFDCMSVESYGYAYLDSSLVGTPYDRGRLGRGGVINGGQVDTGLLKSTPSTREIKEYVNNSWATMESSGRMCFAFSIYYWDLDKISEDNITSYYYRYWTQDEWWSTYYGYSQDRRYDYTCMRAYDDTNGNWGGFGDYNCLPNTITYGEKEVLKVDNTAFNSTYSQTLVSDFKSGFNIDTSDDKLYDIVPYFDAQWTNQMINKYQQAYIIYNLPSNATLQGMDSDNDSINDYQELFTYYTNPKMSDTDNDGYDDGYELTGGTNPNLYYQAPPPNISITISNPTIFYDGTTNISCYSDMPTYNTNFTISNSSGYVIFNTSVMNTTYEFIPTPDMIGNYSVYCYAENQYGNFTNVSATFEVTNVDNQPPYSILNSPLDNYTFPTSTSSVTLNFTALDPDNNNLNITLFRSDGTNTTYLNQPNGTTINYLWNGLSTGNHYSWYINVSDSLTSNQSTTQNFKILKIDYSPSSASKVISAGEDTTINYKIQHNSDENISFNISFLTNLNTTYFNTSFSEDSFTVEPYTEKQITLTINSNSSTEELTYTGTTRIQQSNQDYDTTLTIAVEGLSGIPTIYSSEEESCTINSNSLCYTSGIKTSIQSLEQSFKVKNTGDFELINCQPVLKGDLSNTSVTFVPETFDLPVNSRISLSYLIPNLVEGSYYGYLDILCETNGNNVTLESDNYPMFNFAVINHSSSGYSGGAGTTPTTPIKSFNYSISNNEMAGYVEENISYRIYINNTGNQDIDIELTCEGDLCNQTIIPEYNTTLTDYMQLDILTYLNKTYIGENYLIFRVNEKPKSLKVTINGNFKDKILNKLKSDTKVGNLIINNGLLISILFLLSISIIYPLMLYLPLIKNFKEIFKFTISLLLSLTISFIIILII